jgi:hypothetical protein
VRLPACEEDHQPAVQPVRRYAVRDHFLGPGKGLTNDTADLTEGAAGDGRLRGDVGRHGCGSGHDLPVASRSTVMRIRAYGCAAGFGVSLTGACDTSTEKRRNFEYFACAISDPEI